MCPKIGHNDEKSQKDYDFLKTKQKNEKKAKNKKSDLEKILLHKLQQKGVKEYLGIKCANHLNYDINQSKMNDSCVFWELTSIDNGLFKILANTENDIKISIELGLYFLPKELDGKFTCVINLDVGNGYPSRSNDGEIFDEIYQMEHLSVKKLVGLAGVDVRLNRVGRYGEQFKSCVPTELVSDLREYCACE